jgi:hypothetical protein
VAFVPDIGKDVNIVMKYVSVDSHPREDHSFNIRQIMQGFLPDTVVDSAPYAYQVHQSDSLHASISIIIA